MTEAALLLQSADVKKANIGVAFDAYTAAIVTLGFQTGAFMAEIYRAGIVSIERGQWEAGRAFGMNYLRVMRRVVLPVVVRRMIPAFANRMIEAVNTTSLA